MWCPLLKNRTRLQVTAAAVKSNHWKVRRRARNSCPGVDNDTKGYFRRETQHTQLPTAWMKKRIHSQTKVILRN